MLRVNKAYITKSLICVVIYGHYVELLHWC